MNEKLKEMLDEHSHGDEFWSQWEEDKILAVLVHAAQGKYPGFQLVPVEPTGSMIHKLLADPDASLIDGPKMRNRFIEMLAASREDFK